MPLEPGALARAGKTDGQDHCAFWRKGSGRLCGNCFNGSYGLSGRGRGRRRNGNRSRQAASVASTPSPAAPASSGAADFSALRSRGRMGSGGRRSRILCRLCLRRGGFCNRFVDFCRRRSVRRFSVKILWLQGGRCNFGGGFLRSFLAALEAIAHPFAHVWLVTQARWSGQRNLNAANHERKDTCGNLAAEEFSRIEAGSRLL